MLVSARIICVSYFSGKKQDNAIEKKLVVLKKKKVIKLMENKAIKRFASKFAVDEKAPLSLKHVKIPEILLIRKSCSTNPCALSANIFG
jgi:hypothetical protein